MANNISKCSWTCMIVAMTSCLLFGGLIQQQTFNMWFFISREIISIAWEMPIHWGVHSSHQKWLEHLFWNSHAKVFTCFYVLDFKIWTSILKSKIAKCHVHYISSVLVEPSCRRLIPKSFNLTKRLNSISKKPLVQILIGWRSQLSLMKAYLILEHLFSRLLCTTVQLLWNCQYTWPSHSVVV
jgi:hypothetical protein